MNVFTAFILGLIVGWVIEWIIDWIYWRRRRNESPRRSEAAGAVLAQQADPRSAAGARADLESQLAALKADNSAYQQKIAALEAEKASGTAAGAGASAPGVSASVGLPVPPIPAGLPIPPIPPVPLVIPVPAVVPVPSIPSGGITAPATPSRPADQSEPDQRDERKKQETPDDLIVIKGIGPVIARELNQAGIYTFRQLADLTPDRLRAIVGDLVQRLADEDDIINQARQLAAQKEQSAKL